MRKADIERLGLAEYSLDTQERLIQGDYSKRVTAYPMWFEKNKRYADAIGVDMDTYVMVMNNAQDALSDFLFGIYQGDLATLYEMMRGNHSIHKVRLLQLKDEGILK